MTLKEIEYLLTVARCASISEAAKQLYVAQPSLTHAIQAVEKEIGFRVFERGRSGVSVTERGEEFLGDIRIVYEQMTAVRGKYVEKRPERKVFSVSIQHFSLADRAFIRFSKELEEPFYCTKLLEGKMEDVIADVAAERSELGFIHFTQDKELAVLKELRSEKCEFYSILQSEPCLLIGQDHPLAACDTVSRQDLRPYPLVSYDYGVDSAVYFSEEDAAMLQVDKRVLISDGLTLLHLLTDTDACAVSTKFAEKFIREPGIVARPLEGAQPIQTGWIKKTDVLLQPLAKRFLRMLNPG